VTSPQFQRAAQGFSRGMVIFGSVVLMVCVGLLVVNWWNNHQWLWVVLGIAIIVVNIAMVALTFRKAKLAPPIPDRRDEDN